MSADGRGTPPLTRAEPFDFERLERSIEHLLDEHRRLSVEREALLAELGDREHRIATLESQLEAEQRRRTTAIEAVDRVLARVEALQSDVADVGSQAR